MDFTGHKSVPSLTIYQRVSNERKMEMAKTLTDAIKNKVETKQTPQVQPALVPVQVPPPKINVPTDPVEVLQNALVIIQNAVQLPQESLIVPYKPNWDDDTADFDLLISYLS